MVTDGSTRRLDRSEELYSNYLQWKDTHRVETQVNHIPNTMD